MKRMSFAMLCVANFACLLLNLYIYTINFQNLYEIPEYKLPDWVQYAAAAVIREEKYPPKTMSQAQDDYCRFGSRKAAIPGLVIDVKPVTPDGDVHITVADGLLRMVFEIDKDIPLPLPKVGDYILGYGMVSFDEGFPCQGDRRSHGWYEFNPTVKCEKLNPKQNKLFTVRHGRLVKRLVASRDGLGLK